jgi:hypothetical protein
VRDENATALIDVVAAIPTRRVRPRASAAGGWQQIPRGAAAANRGADGLGLNPE